MIGGHVAFDHDHVTLGGGVALDAGEVEADVGVDEVFRETVAGGVFGPEVSLGGSVTPVSGHADPANGFNAVFGDAGPSIV